MNNTYNLVHAPYYNHYVELFSSKELEASLIQNLEDTLVMISTIPTDKHDYAYDEGKWTIKEVMAHILDTERVMAYRALRIARGDQSNIKGFDQDEFMINTIVDSISMDEFIAEFKSLRESNILMFRNFNEDQLNRVGKASDNAISVASLAYIICGHVKHHCDIITERYLN